MCIQAIASFTVLTDLGTRNSRALAAGREEKYRVLKTINISRKPFIPDAATRSDNIWSHRRLLRTEEGELPSEHPPSRSVGVDVLRLEFTLAFHCQRAAGAWHRGYGGAHQFVCWRN